MTSYEKDILLKDLCARLPYGVKVLYDNQIFEVQYIEPMYGELKLLDNESYTVSIEEVKPYLFPLSSMTEEQRIELYKVLGLGYESHYHLSKEWEDFNNSIDNNDLFLPASWVSDLNKMYDWLNKNHFDYQGLIPMGLAIDATNKDIY